MDRRNFIRNSLLALGYSLAPEEPLASAEQDDGKTVPHRGWTICVDPHLGSLGERAIQAIRSRAPANVLLQVLSGSRSPDILNTEQIQDVSVPQLSLAHVLVIGLPQDRFLQAVSQREAAFQREGALYVFGLGNFTGTIGYIESDRNPLLHAAAVSVAPFEAEMVTITGTNAAGVSLALDAFLNETLVNGIVAQPGWSRGPVTLLDRDPLHPDFVAPAYLPLQFGDMKRISLTMATGDEYLGVVEDTGVEPSSIWRAKYYRPGVWDIPGAPGSFPGYAAGLHRRAYGNTVWAADFGSQRAASAAVQHIAANAQLRPEGEAYRGSLPPYAWGSQPGDAPSTGILRVWTNKEVVLMSAKLGS